MNSVNKINKLLHVALIIFNFQFLDDYLFSLTASAYSKMQCFGIDGECNEYQIRVRVRVTKNVEG